MVMPSETWGLLGGHRHPYSMDGGGGGVVHDVQPEATSHIDLLSSSRPPFCLSTPMALSLEEVFHCEPCYDTLVYLSHQPF
jgi:hypothetical protein